MTVTLEKLPKAVKDLPEDAQAMWVDAYNQDFGWRSSEAHAEKVAWRTIDSHYEQSEDGSWAKKA